MFDAVMDAPFGKIGVRTAGDWIAEIVYLPASFGALDPLNATARDAVHQLTQYLQSPSHPFSLRLKPVGTAFQRRVWDAIEAIPAGRVATYGGLARALASAPRAIGQACGANHFPIVIPCHRVVSAGGIGGFANSAEEGYFRNVKRWLLQHEGLDY
ncbi:MAG: methylated-DNA--[protein]-cysteine S-methyltransferase [Janthinobacterium lividum]